MKDNGTANLLKLMVVTIAALILAFVAFGVGVGVGAAGARPAADTSSLPFRPEAALADPTPTREPSALVKPEATRPAVEPSRIEPGATTGKTPLDTALFNEAWGLLQEQFYGELPEGEDITYAAIRGIISTLDDEHTSFLDPETAQLFEAEMEGEFEGIGARVRKAESGGVEITYLFDDQPAVKAGLEVGDVILAVDGKDITGLDINAAIALIRGRRGTAVVLTIQRGDEDPADIEVVRARIEIPVVETKTLADGRIEYIALAEFSSTAPRRVTEAMQAAMKKEPDGLVLDLRGNPGGLLDAAVEITSLFVREGNVLIERFKDAPERVYPREGRYLLGDTPLVVLVDEGSASASEILAGAVQDTKAGTLVGTTTFGKGSVQLPNSLSDGSQLRITIARWFTPAGRGIHDVGLQPDLEVTLTEEDIKADRDPQLDRAVEFLLTGK